MTKLEGPSPTAMPPWDKEVKPPARWFAKFSQLLRNSTSIFKELGKVVPHQLTKIAKARYYSISDEGRKSIKDI